MLPNPRRSPRGSALIISRQRCEGYRQVREATWRTDVIRQSRLPAFQAADAGDNPSRSQGGTLPDAMCMEYC
jgi:hypothetical protein